MPRPRRESRGERPSSHRPHDRDGERERERERHRTKRAPASPEKSSGTGSTSQSSSQALSADSLAKLDALNNGAKLKERQREKERDRERDRDRERHGKATRAKKHQQHRRKRRVVSGAAMEEGKGDIVRRRGGGGDDYGGRKNRKCLWIMVGIFLLLLIILIPVGVLVVGKKGNAGAGASSSKASAGGAPSNNNLNSISQADVPAAAKGTVLDPFSWYDTGDFNVTYTDAKVGGLPVMGLNSSFDDTKKANDHVPPLNQPWQYGIMPIRGVNVGGWLSLEPFITPSLFSSYDSKLGVVDEYTLTKHLGPTPAAQTLEKHYATFVTEQTFRDIAAAGLDHVRIPFSYWAVVTYPDDPYVPQISWRYLLRGIEWARKHGLRVNLDLHAVPGSQNGWNHSGRQGAVGWLNGTDGALNGQRSLDIHNQLSQFFAQPRYKNVVTIYGLVNEPKMTKLQVATVNEWTSNAMQIVQKNGVTAKIVFADGFLGLPNWKGKFTMLKDLVLDVHQYVIFNTDQLAFTHKTKIEFACSGWTGQMLQSSDQSTGFGPTLCGEWSQADTDCAQYLNNVNVGSRWTGDLNLADPSAAVLTPTCPKAGAVAGSGPSGKGTDCSCTQANASPSSYSPDYKKWLLTFAEAQMTSFERGWGWFYWTWDTEEAVQWSWKKGLAAGILPSDPSAKGRDFNCTTGELGGLDWGGLPENY